MRVTISLNPTCCRGREGSLLTPPLLIFSCVRARDLKIYDFLNIAKEKLVNYFFATKIIFAATGLRQNFVKKKATLLFRAMNQKKKFKSFFLLNYKNIVKTFKN